MESLAVLRLGVTCALGGLGAFSVSETSIVDCFGVEGGVTFFGEMFSATSSSESDSAMTQTLLLLLGLLQGEEGGEGLDSLAGLFIGLTGSEIVTDFNFFSIDFGVFSLGDFFKDGFLVSLGVVSFLTFSIILFLLGVLLGVFSLSTFSGTSVDGFLAKGVVFLSSKGLTGVLLDEKKEVIFFWAAMVRGGDLVKGAG